MNRRTTPLQALACALALMLALAGCGGEEPAQIQPVRTSPTVDAAAAAEEKAVLDAFDRYWDDQVSIASSGKVPKDALEDSATGPQRENEIARLTKDAEQGITRTGAPKFKDQKVTVTGDTALLVACINDDEWKFTIQDGKTVSPTNGWRQLGRDFTKVDGDWLVTGGSEESTSETCP